MTSALEHGTEDTPGRLGAVLRAGGAAHPVALGRHGPWLVTTLAQARAVLTDPVGFDFPTDVSRRATFRAGDDARPRHEPFTAFTRDKAAVASTVLRDELAASTGGADVEEHDAMQLLRRPVARATAAASLDEIDDADRDLVADAVLGWVDSLAPVISASRPPRRWSRVRRDEEAARSHLHSLLGRLGDPAPVRTATVLAAGTQVPIAAGAWLLMALAERPALQRQLANGVVEPTSVVWEVLRLTPPTWVTARVARSTVDVAGVSIPEGGVVLVSALLLGRRPDLVPSGGEDGEDDRDRFLPQRWQNSSLRPGSWLPFGTGPNACPGRSVGLAQLVAIASWASGMSLRLTAPVQLDQSRGIFPRPARFDVLGRDDVEGRP